MLFKILKPTFSGILQIAILLFAVYYTLDSGAKAMGYTWQWQRIPDYIVIFDEGEWWSGELLEGLLVTLKISGLGLIATLNIGLITALLRQSDSIVGRVLARGYVEIIRNTPLLVQIYILYFIFGPILGLDRLSTAIAALALFQGAYTAEIFRSGLNSISIGQFEAAKSLGLSTYYTYKQVILPQVIQKTLPPLTNEAISLIKNSSIVSVMAIFDLTTEGRNIVSETAMPFEVWFTVAIIYLLLTLSLSGLAAWLEHKLGAQWRT